MCFRRFAIYYVPPPGAFRAAGESWLGHDLTGGKQQDAASSASEGARRYGFHATMQPPFRAAEGADIETLEHGLARLCRHHAPVRCAGLEIGAMGRFLALRPVGGAAALVTLAAATVRAFRDLRAPLTEAEKARHAARPLTARQRENLETWGYPFVIEDFRWHMTLTDRLDPEARARWRDAAERHFTGSLPRPFVLNRLSLVGEDGAGLFHEIASRALTGDAADGDPGRT